ncbi:TraB/GumN family protein [Candidatus Woesearchaeota archaeon]|nr:TraB/GumN family protein [Candidatus Woesearchaeota archaeon]
MANQMNNIKILGTSHIAKQSVEDVRKAIEEFHPEIVAVELDSKRYLSLLDEKKRKKSKFSFAAIPKIGLKGYLFGIIGSYASKKLGNVVGATPGDEMLTAIKEAKKRNLEVALIDQDIEITLSRFSKALSWKEKWMFLKDIFNSIFRKKKVLAEYKELGLDLETLDLTQVPSNKFITILTTAMKKKYPNIYRVLVSERNSFMVRTLVKMRKKYPEKKIIAVVGAGHVEGMEKELLRYEFV